MKHTGATSTKTAHNFGLKTFVIMLMALCFSGMWNSLSLALEPPITSSGLNTQVSEPTTLPSGQTSYNITGGTRPGGETNLFHSFGDFNVPNNNIANFLNDSGLATSNILGRVTGGNPSSIFGTIQTIGFSNANLFLMNPAGIVFGPNASLNVGGSVNFTTADYLRFADGGMFTAVPGSLDTSISIAPVVAFGFLGTNPAAITVQGSQLSVAPAKSITLVGGDITIDGATLGPNSVQSAQLSGPGRQINLASVASAGEIFAGTLEQAPNINGQSFGALGAIQISDQSSIVASGNAGGTVLIRGGQFVLDNSKISANITGPGPFINGAEATGGGIDIKVNQGAMIRNAALLETNVLGSANPGITYGGVQVKAEHIEIDGTDRPLDFTGIRSNVNVLPTSQGATSGNITLDANSILIKGSGTLETTVQGSEIPPAPGEARNSKAGDITVTADHNLELNGSTISSLIMFDSGTAGDITLTSRHGSIVELGNLPPPDFIFKPGDPLPPITPNFLFNQSIGPGKAGNVTLNAPEGDIQLAGALMVLTLQPLLGGLPVQEAGSGQVHFTANNLQLINNSTVQMDNFSTLPAGNFNVALNGDLTVNSSRIITTARGPAQAADLNIRAQDVLVTQGGSLSTETRSSGQGGQLNISADTIQVTNGGQLRSGSTLPRGPNGVPIEVPLGPGGTVRIQGRTGPVADSILIDGQKSGISTNTDGTGAGGNTFLSARSLTIQNGGTISAETSGTTPSATGGSISVKATDHATMTSGASITASSTGPGDAGNILINAGHQFDMRDSSVTAEAKQASGGNIDVQAVDRVRLVNSEISSSVQGGASTAGGNIKIDPNVIVLQNSDVTAKAVQGAGGNITLTTPLFLRDSTSLVSASSQFGVNGTVTIQSPTSNLSESLGTLPSQPNQAQALLTQRCAALANGQTSSFVVAGREQLPSDPGGWLSSPLAFAALGESLDTDNAVASIPTVMAIAADDTSTVSLRRLTPAGFLMANFADSEATGCHS